MPTRPPHPTVLPCGLRGYARTIAGIAGTDDPGLCALIEELMRTEHPALDGLDMATFRNEVAISVACAAQLDADGDLAAWCATMQVPYPREALAALLAREVPGHGPATDA